MKIALISYEAYDFSDSPPAGGIGTYVRNAGAMLALRGHHVEVFTGGEMDRSIRLESGVAAHIISGGLGEFSQRVLPVFMRRHREIGFDVAEGPEYNADAAFIFDAVPELPRVVKLHTPSFVIAEINRNVAPWPQRWQTRMRFTIGSLRRGRLPDRYWIYDPAQDREWRHTVAADVVTAPSRAMIKRVERAWKLSTDDVECVPNIFVPPAQFLRVGTATDTHRVTFLGRLECRKGVVELAEAIPRVLRAAPRARFRFVGRSGCHPHSGEDFKSYLLRLLGSYAEAVEFIDRAPYLEIPRLLAETDLCVFPSIWENFPYVCLEAMSAVRAVIGSSAGGMGEMIEHGKSGLLVPPGDPGALAAAILALLANPGRRIAMGSAARKRVLNAYSVEAVGPLQEASYLRAIERAKQRCSKTG